MSSDLEFAKMALKLGFVTRVQVQECIAVSKAKGIPLRKVLVHKGYLKAPQLSQINHQMAQASKSAPIQIKAKLATQRISRKARAQRESTKIIPSKIKPPVPSKAKASITGTPPRRRANRETRATRQDASLAREGISPAIRPGPTASKPLAKPVAGADQGLGEESRADIPAVVAQNDFPRLSGYDIFSIIGEGAMGTVYAAYQLSTGRKVAIKVLSPELQKNHDFLKRFFREIRCVAKLNHENIVSDIDVVMQGGLYFLVMEFLEGENVAQILERKGSISERKALDIVIQVTQALCHAHEHGLIHRDIKPENIMLSPDKSVKICDLGLLKEVTEPTGQVLPPEESPFVRTPQYISPEQAQGVALDTRSDIYSLGITLFHMVTGRVPFLSSNPTAVRNMHVKKALPDPRQWQPQLSDDVCALIFKMTAKDPDSRFQNPHELLEALITVRNHLKSGNKLDDTLSHPVYSKSTAYRFKPQQTRQRTSLLGGGKVVPEFQRTSIRSRSPSSTQLGFSDELRYRETSIRSAPFPLPVTETPDRRWLFWLLGLAGGLLLLLLIFWLTKGTGAR